VQIVVTIPGEPGGEREREPACHQLVAPPGDQFAYALLLTQFGSHVSLVSRRRKVLPAYDQPAATRSQLRALARVRPEAVASGRRAVGCASLAEALRELPDEPFCQNVGEVEDVTVDLVVGGDVCIPVALQPGERLLRGQSQVLVHLRLHR